MQQMVDYANYVKEQRSEDPTPKETPAPVIFDAGPSDLPLLPLLVKGCHSVEIAKHTKDVIRAYFLRHYRRLP